MSSTLNTLADQTINLVNGAAKYPNYSGPLTISSTGGVIITANNGEDGIYNDQVTFDFITPTLVNNGAVYAGGAYGSADGGIGVDMQVFSAVVNNGVIRGGSSHGEVVVGGGAYGVGGVGVYLKGGSLTNNATNYGAAIYGGTAYNGGRGGVGVVDHGGSVYNYGVIRGGAGAEGGVGVELDFSAQGLGQTQLVNKGVVSGGIGVEVNANTFLTNSGTVYGGSIGVDISGGTVYNSGQIDAYNSLLVTKGPHYDAVNFNNSVAGGKLVLELPNDGKSTAGLEGSIGGFASGDTVEIANLTPTQAAADFNTSTYTLTDNGPVKFAGSFVGQKFSFTADPNGGTDITLTAACYASGSRIRLAGGQSKAVEALRIGDQVETMSGKNLPVRWIGFRSIDCTKHPEPAAVWPIRIRAGAIAEQLPKRDLWVSPGHSIFIHGVLIQAEKLINGATIVQEPVERIDYWHVELDQHHVIFAEDMPSESYLDTGNRQAFINGGEFVEAHPDFRPKHWTDTCAPLIMEGDELRRAKATVLARASALGWEIASDAAIHIVADGKRIDPTHLTPTRVAFLIPERRTRIELCSRYFVPAHIDATSGDTRTLGICVGRLQLDGAEIALEDEAAFSIGWHGLERGPDGHQWRWSQDRVPLPAGARLVVIDIDYPGFYWARSANEAMALLA